MCRQSTFPGPVDLILMVLILTTHRVRVEGKRGIMTKKLLDDIPWATGKALRRDVYDTLVLMYN